MMITLLFMATMMFNIMFLFTSHPLTLTLIIIIQTIFIASISGLILYSFWFSYMLLLIFLGGMLVLFIYITTLASNETFPNLTKTNMINIFMTIPILFLIFQMLPLIILLKKNQDSFQNNNLMFMSNELNKNLTQLYNYPNMNLTIIAIIYLLITLIVVVKITQINEGPLRHSLTYE